MELAGKMKKIFCVLWDAGMAKYWKKETEALAPKQQINELRCEVDGKQPK